MHSSPFSKFSSPNKTRTSYDDEMCVKCMQKNSKWVCRCKDEKLCPDCLASHIARNPIVVHVPEPILAQEDFRITGTTGETVCKAGVGKNEEILMREALTKEMIRTEELKSRTLGDLDRFLDIQMSRLQAQAVVCKKEIERRFDRVIHRLQEIIRARNKNSVDEEVMKIVRMGEDVVKYEFFIHKLPFLKELIQFKLEIFNEGICDGSLSFYDSIQTEDMKHSIRFQPTSNTNHLILPDLNSNAISEYKASISCPQNHSLDYISNLSSYFTSKQIPSISECSLCKSNNLQSGCICSICAYLICSICSQNLLDASQSLLKCPSHHYLRKYLPSTPPKSCKFCSSSLTSIHSSCRLCKFDVCNGCSDLLLEEVISKNPKIRCPNSHYCVWRDDSFTKYPNNEFSCSLCSTKYKEVGSITCEVCDYNICLNCLKSRTHLH